MLTIAGSGMGPYSLRELTDTLPLDPFEAIVLDSNYDNPGNEEILAPHRHRIHFENLPGCRTRISQMLRERMDRAILYVVTGSPLFYSGTRSLLDLLEGEVAGFRRDHHAKIRPALSSLDALLLATGIDASETGSLSLHGREVADLSELLRRRYTFILCDGQSLGRLGGMLSHLGDDDVTITIGSRLGYKDERIFSLKLSELSALPPEDAERLMPYSLLVERRFATGRPYPGEGDFASDGGMITKREKRRMALQDLELQPGQLLWDVGAGSGSVSVEAFLRHRVRTVLFEKNHHRIEDIHTNLKRHRVLASRLVAGDATDAFAAERENPDRIFVGGGGTEMAKSLPLLYDRLSPGGKLVAHYVVLNHFTEAVASLGIAATPFHVRSISLTHFRAGDLMLADTERLLFIIQCNKPEKTEPNGPGNKAQTNGSGEHESESRKPRGNDIG